MQLNWGEYNQDKFIYILNPEQNDITKIQNNSRILPIFAAEEPYVDSKCAWYHYKNKLK